MPNRIARRQRELHDQAVVAEIDTTDLRARLDAAQAEQEERRSRLTIATRNRDTNQALLKQNFISQNAYDQTQSTYQGSDAAVRWADAQVRMATKAINDAVVRSPIAGFILEKQIARGAHVTPGQTLYRIADVAVVWVEAAIYEQDLSLVRIGSEATVTVDAYPGESFTGRASYMYPAVDPQTRASIWQFIWLIWIGLLQV